MPIISIILAVLALITVVAYFKQLSPTQRAKQASVLRDVSAMSVVATATFAKDLSTAAISTGRLAAKTVEAEHAEAIDKARTSVDSVIQANGGTIKQAGLNLGHKASSAVYLTDANIALAKAIKDLEAKGF